jgi:hypothetical protein
VEKEHATLLEIEQHNLRALNHRSGNIFRKAVQCSFQGEKLHPHLEPRYRGGGGGGPHPRGKFNLKPPNCFCWSRRRSQCFWTLSSVSRAERPAKETRHLPSPREEVDRLQTIVPHEGRKPVGLEGGVSTRNYAKSWNMKSESRPRENTASPPPLPEING